MMKPNLLGQHGEALAAEYLASIGLQVIAKNVRHKQFEVDLMALDNLTQQIVIVEVKTIHTSGFHDVFDTITPAKLKKLSLAVAYLSNSPTYQYKGYTDFRVDLIGIIFSSGQAKPEIRYIKNIEFD